MVLEHPLVSMFSSVQSLSSIWLTETPVLWPPHAKSWLTGKDSDAGRDWGQEEKGITKDEMAGWRHWLNGHEWTLGVGDGQGGPACCDSWGRKESDTTEWLNWTELNCDPLDCSTPGFPVHNQHLKLALTHVHQVSDAIQPSHLLLSPSPPALKLFQHQSLFRWVSSLN